MRERYIGGALLALMIAAAAPVGATSVSRMVPDPDKTQQGLGGTRISYPPYLQCVPYARRVTGVHIYGDAHTWWGQAEGRYAKGSVPKVGAVMAFRAGGSSRLGHVAAVSRIVDSRTVLISHSNWSPINGRRGQIEKNVRAIDVSEDNDWSSVRVWYAPIKAMGGRHWALSGFIYNEKPGARGRKLAKPLRESDHHSRRTSAKTPVGGSDPIGDLIARLR